MSRQCSRDVCGSAYQDFVVRGKIESRDRKMKRGGAAADRDAIFASAIRRECFFETWNRLPKRTGDLAASNGRGDGGDFFFTDDGLENWNPFFITPTLTLSFSLPLHGPPSTPTPSTPPTP